MPLDGTLRFFPPRPGLAAAPAPALILAYRQPYPKPKPGTLRFCFLRGAWHKPPAGWVAAARVAAARARLNSGLAEHADDWLPTHGRSILIRTCHRVHFVPPARRSSTRAPSIDAGAAGHANEPHPFASRMPHLDELTPGEPTARTPS